MKLLLLPCLALLGTCPVQSAILSEESIPAVIHSSAQGFNPIDSAVTPTAGSDAPALPTDPPAVLFGGLGLLALLRRRYP